MIAIFPEIAGRAATGDFENLAVLVRKYFGGRDTFAPSPDIADLVDNVGIKIQRVPFECNGALLARDERGAFEIIAIVREGTDAEAERFLLAHLLGHFMFDVQPLIARGDWTVSGFREVVCPMKRYSNGYAATDVSAADIRKDELADDFAAALLMPKGMVVRAMEKIGSLERVAAFFGVPRSCLTRRLHQIGVRENHSADFLTAERQMGRSAPAYDSGTGYLSRDLDPLDGLAREVGPIASPTIVPPRITIRSAGASKAPKAPNASAPEQPVAKSRQSIPIFEEMPRTKEESTGALQKGMERIRQIAKLLDKNTSK